MADDVVVKFSAQIGELQSNLNQAVASMKAMADSVTSAFDKSGGAGQKFNSKMETALNVGLFLEFKEVATLALGAVRDAFESTVGKAEEFGLTTARFAAQMGMNMTEAAALASALDDVGSSTEQYSGMAMRMTMRLKQSEQAWNSLGMATRNSSGELLQGKDLLDSAISTMQGFKQGTDQNSFALEVFGRSASGVYDIMRVTDELIEQNKQQMAEFGVVTGDQAAGAAAKLQLALADTKDQFEFAAIAIGQHLMPVVTDLVDQFNTVLTPVLKYAIQFFEALVIAIDLLIMAFMDMGTILGTVLVEMGTALAGFATIAWDVLSGQWGKVQGDFNDYTNRMRVAFEYSMDTMAERAAGFVARAKSIFAGLDAPEEKKLKNPYDSKGTKSFDDPKQRMALNQEILAGEMARALEEIRIEQDKNNAMHALGQKSLEDYLATARQLENRKYEIQADGLRRKMALDAGNIVEVQKDKNKLEMLELQHQGALNRIDQQGASQRKQMADADRQFEMQQLDQQMADAQDHNQSLLRQGQITEEEEFALEKKLTTEVYGENLARLDGQIATLAKGTREWQKAMQDRAKLSQKFATDIRKIDDQLAEYEHQKWNKLGNTIKSSFTGALNGMLMGTKTWQQGVGEIIDGIANAFLTMAEDMLTNWIATELNKMLFSKATAAAGAIGQISSAAGVAGANTFASTSAIPVIGPELAPAAAAAAVAQTMGFSSLAVAEKGMVLDRDRLVSAHKDEMVLPAGISGGLQAMIAGGKGRGETNLHYSPTLNGGGGHGLRDLLAKDAKAMREWIHSGLRDGSLKMAGA